MTIFIKAKVFFMFINIKGRLLDLRHPRIMGIINVTEDSFYPGSCHTTDEEIVATAGKMLEDGADMLDIGGCSTRPGAKEVPDETEKKRVCRAVELISLIHISEPTRRTPISYAAFC